jgi:hypothetical protein
MSMPSMLRQAQREEFISVLVLSLPKDELAEG